VLPIRFLGRSPQSNQRLLGPPAYLRGAAGRVLVRLDLPVHGSGLTPGRAIASVTVRQGIVIPPADCTDSHLNRCSHRFPSEDGPTWDGVASHSLQLDSRPRLAAAGLFPDFGSTTGCRASRPFVFVARQSLPQMPSGCQAEAAGIGRILSPFSRLQSRCASVTLLGSCRPPALSGIVWSRVGDFHFG